MDDLKRVVKVLRDDGWTCEGRGPYHEPDEKCEVCQRLHKNTAERILAALGITDTEKPRGAGPGLHPDTAYEQDEG